MPPVMSKLLGWPFNAIFFLLILAVLLWLFENPAEIQAQPTDQNLSAEQAETLVEEEMLKCSQHFNPAGCTEQASRIFLSQMTYDQLMGSLKTVTKNPVVYEICHPLVHFIGRASYKQERNMEKLFATDGSVCDSGFYHGVIEQNLAERGIIIFQDEQAKSFQGVTDICGSIADYSIPLRYSSCIHGLGHGLMYVTDNDLPISLKGCDTIRGASTCYGGVFMENAGSTTNPFHYSKYLRDDDPLYPCNNINDKYELACWRYQSLHFARLTNRDWARTIEMCLQIPDSFQGTCIQFVGSNLINYSEDANLMKSVLTQVPSQYQPQYITGLVSGLGEDNVGVPAKMKVVCDFLEGTNLENGCYKDMGVAIRAWSFDSAERLNFCEENLTGVNLETCASAAIANFESYFYRVFSTIEDLTYFKLE